MWRSQPLLVVLFAAALVFRVERREGVLLECNGDVSIPASERQRNRRSNNVSATATTDGLLKMY